MLCHLSLLFTVSDEKGCLTNIVELEREMRTDSVKKLLQAEIADYEKRVKGRARTTLIRSLWSTRLVKHSPN